MPADVSIPLHPPDVSGCPRGVPLPPLSSVVPWAGPPSPSLQAWAARQLGYPLGTVIRDTVDGLPVVARIECHFAYGAHPEQPGNWHKGTSVYRPAAPGPGGKLVALATPPDGWPSSA